MHPYLSTVLLLSAVLAAGPASAVPITLTDVLIDLQGEAVIADSLGAPVDTAAFAESPSVLPVLFEAPASSPSDSSAYAFAQAESGFLSVGTDTLAAGDETAVAQAVASLSAQFSDAAATRFRLSLDLSFSQQGGGPGVIELIYSASGLAKESLRFDTAVADSVSLLRVFELPAGVAVGTLELLLTAGSEAASSNLASLNFAIESVPEPGSLPLLAIAGLAFGASVRRRESPCSAL